MQQQQQKSSYSSAGQSVPVSSSTLPTAIPTRVANFSRNPTYPVRTSVPNTNSPTERMRARSVVRVRVGVFFCPPGQLPGLYLSEMRPRAGGGNTAKTRGSSSAQCTCSTSPERRKKDLKTPPLGGCYTEHRAVAPSSPVVVRRLVLFGAKRPARPASCSMRASDGSSCARGVRAPTSRVDVRVSSASHRPGTSVVSRQWIQPRALAPPACCRVAQVGAVRMWRGAAQSCVFASSSALQTSSAATDRSPWLALRLRVHHASLRHLSGSAPATRARP